MRSHLNLFIGRIAIICNALFLYCVVVRHTKDFIGNQDINSIIITLGWGASFFINLLFNLLWLMMVFRKRQVAVPKWILFTNLAMLIIQIVMLMESVI